MWGSSGIDCLYLRSCLEETVCCDWETGRASDTFNLNYTICVNLCLFCSGGFMFGYYLTTLILIYISSCKRITVSVVCVTVDGVL